MDPPARWGLSGRVPAHRGSSLRLWSATDLLRAAEGPVAITGSGMWWSGAGEALRGFIERASIVKWLYSR